MKWLHTLGSIGLLVLTALTPALQTTITSHPVASTVVASVYAILGHLLPSPVQSKGL